MKPLAIHRLIGLAFAAAAAIAEAAPSFEADAWPYFRALCVGCHGDAKQEGGFRIDTLSREVGAENTPQWAGVLARITAEEMPPEEVKDRPKADESAAIVEWLAARLEEGEAARLARRGRDTLDDWELASRLSYLLWSTMPDDELFALAEQGRLRDRAELRRQAERLLADPRARRFSESFATQWLRLRKIGMFQPDKKLYPDYDRSLETSMIGETISFFHEVLDRNLATREFLDSDWTMANARLARFYGLPELEGPEFRRVSLPRDGRRGGLLRGTSSLVVRSMPKSCSRLVDVSWLSDAMQD